MISTISTFFLGLTALASIGCATTPSRAAVAPLSAACHQLENPREAASAFYAPGAASAPKGIELNYSRQNWTGELVGVEVFVRASPGTTPEYLQRALMCHASDSRQAASPSDPLRPLGGLSEVRVRTAGHGYLVSLFGNDVSSSRDALERARVMAGVAHESIDMRQISKNDVLPHP